MKKLNKKQKQLMLDIADQLGENKDYIGYMKKIKIGLFIDEDVNRKRSISSIKKQFKKYKPSYIEDICISDKLINNDGFDLVIIDYGALTSMPGNSLGEHYARYINKYAENHPNTLFVYITVMGEHWLRNEGLNLDDLHNIKWCHTEDVIYLYERNKNESK